MWQSRQGSATSEAGSQIHLIHQIQATRALDSMGGSGLATCASRDPL